MTKMTRVIGCVSSEQRQHLIFRSMVRVLGQGATSSLKHQWSFSDVGPFDVRIVDIDDEEHVALADEQGQGVVVVLAGNQQILVGRQFTLSKPLRGNEFLQLLQAIEAAGFEARVTADAADIPVATAPAAPAEPNPLKTESNVKTAPTISAQTEILISLESWPDLPRMADDMLHDAARICALLSVRPSSRETISRFLDIPPENVNRVLKIIPACSHAGDIRTLHEHQSAATEANNVIPLHDQVSGGKPSSLLSKLWNRLRGAA
ncbi:MAG: hypothetical protein Q7T36_11545 [Fluviicoccus sp.]|uniref:hypothetical protein n=1 Tax=Fluviicoccus sp. TaxID=2003552 RepID=UPI0027229393|nr:hypothetical protein [Fluviicoccus sp.]MDO8331092.1 hypothetical protein [Fluviicoccus sp.]